MRSCYNHRHMHRKISANCDDKLIIDIFRYSLWVQKSKNLQSALRGDDCPMVSNPDEGFLRLNNVKIDLQLCLVF